MATFLGYSQFNGKNGDKFSADLLYDIIEQNINENYTVVRLYGYIRSWGYSGSGSYANFVINGEVAGGFNRINSNQYIEVARRDIPIKHNAEGKANLDWSFSVDTTWALGDASASGSIALPTIPRKSKVTCTDGNIGSAVSINIQSASSSFVHTLRFNFVALNGELAYGVVDNYGWTIPDSFYSQIPNSKSGTGTITCETYSGGTLIGTTSTTFRAYAVEGNCNPQVSATIEDTNPLSIGLTGDKNKLIKGVSNALIKVTATPRKNATLTRVGAKCNDGQRGSGNEVTLFSVADGNFSAYATDTRGFNVVKPYARPMIKYIPLTCNIDIYRPQPTTGEVKLNVSGNYFNESFGKASNTLELKYRFKEVDGTFGNYVTITPTITDNKYSFSASLGKGFDYQKAYDFEIVATDKIRNLIVPYHVAEGIPMFAMFKDHLEAFGQDLLVPFVLYDNDTGNNTKITLSDDIKKYKYLEVFNKVSLGDYQTYTSTKVPVKNGMCISVDNTTTHSYLIAIQYTSRWKAENNTITKIHEIGMRFNTGGSVSSDGNTQKIMITKVLGYR